MRYNPIFSSPKKESFLKNLAHNRVLVSNLQYIYSQIKEFLSWKVIWAILLLYFTNKENDVHRVPQGSREKKRMLCFLTLISALSPWFCTVFSFFNGFTYSINIYWKFMCNALVSHWGKIKRKWILFSRDVYSACTCSCTHSFSLFPLPNSKTNFRCPRFWSSGAKCRT